MSNMCEEAHVLVKDLFKFRDQYFVHNPVCDKPSKRDEDVDEKLQETLKKIDEFTADMTGREKNYNHSFLRGKALNIKPDYSQEAFDLLSKAIKLNPVEADAWNNLGECYWKNGDINGALNCFENAMKYNKESTESIRNLSMCLRQVRDTPQKSAANLERSLELANQAVRIDISDGFNWLLLGNAYKTKFCRSPNVDLTLLSQCKKAYSRAKLDTIAFNQPDFLYNYSNVLVYEENYQEAIDYLTRASLMDPSWQELHEWRQSITKFLIQLHNMIDKRASLKTKRLTAMITDLVSKGQQQLGNFTKENNYAINNLNQLVDGENEKSAIAFKIIGCVSYAQEVSKTICVVDSENQSCAVSLFNVGREPKIGDTIVIGDPLVRDIKTTFDQTDIEFKCIRVDRPELTFVNGRTFPTEYLARPRVNNVIRRY